MMTSTTIPATANADADLVNATLGGSREAFSLIVSRYQSLICSLAYSATGSLGQSEDLAQETFITAWKHLGHLREREKLRPWLCGIARNRINNFLRREGREPVRAAESLDEVAESHSPEPLPVDYVISQEEAALLWRSLEKIPATYREPLILFYREHQSVEAVAEKLDLTEEAVHQRLSRGRKLLQEQVLAFVEGALRRTKPGKTFTFGVLASIPALALPAKAAVAGALAKSGGTAKTAGIMLWPGMLLGLLAVVLPNYLGYRVALAAAPSAAERAGVRNFFRKVGGITLGLFLPYVAAVLWWSGKQPDHAYLPGLLATGMAVIFVLTIFIVAYRSAGKSRAYYVEVLAKECGGVFPAPAWEYQSVTCWLGLPLVHIRVGDRFAVLRKPVRAWIAVGNRAMGGLFAFGAMAVAPVSIGGLSIGVLSFGGLSIGLFALGGIALGFWAVFGGLTVGWEAAGCVAVAWHAAVGELALAHDFALGPLAWVAQPDSQTLVEWRARMNSADPGGCFRVARFINDHWLWLNLLWMVPFFIQWRISVGAKKRPRN
jgi:RNA polymerase sigma factor (sigma-70 family)